MTTYRAFLPRRPGSHSALATTRCSRHHEVRVRYRRSRERLHALPDTRQRRLDREIRAFSREFCPHPWSTSCASHQAVISFVPTSPRATIRVSSATEPAAAPPGASHRARCLRDHDNRQRRRQRVVWHRRDCRPPQQQRDAVRRHAAAVERGLQTPVVVLYSVSPWGWVVCDGNHSHRPQNPSSPREIGDGSGLTNWRIIIVPLCRPALSQSVFASITVSRLTTPERNPLVTLAARSRATRR